MYFGKKSRAPLLSAPLLQPSPFDAGARSPPTAEPLALRARLLPTPRACSATSFGKNRNVSPARWSEVSLHWPESFLWSGTGGMAPPLEQESSPDRSSGTGEVTGRGAATAARRQSERRPGVAVALFFALAPVFVVVAQLVADAGGTNNDSWTITAGGVLLRSETNAGKHLFPYMATAVSFGLLLLACFCVVQNGGQLAQLQ